MREDENQSQRAIEDLIQEVVSSVDVQASSLGTALSQYIEPLSVPNAYASVGVARQLHIVTKGDTVTATTRKLTNLRFRIKELLQEGAVTAMGEPPPVVTSAASWVLGQLLGIDISKQLGFVLLALRFLKQAYELADMPVEPLDARILLTINQLALMKETVTNDSLVSAAADKLAPAEREYVPATLDRLEQLGCIVISPSGRIKLTESLVILSQS